MKSDKQINKKEKKYNEILKKFQKKYFPDLEDKNIKFKPLNILKKVFMITLPFSNDIFYNVNLVKKCDHRVMIAALMHELYHIHQFERLNFLQKILFIPRYHISKKYRIKHEKEAHIQVTKMGFGEELIQLNKYVKSRYPIEVWEKKWSDYYLSEDEICNIMNNNKSIGIDNNDNEV